MRYKINEERAINLDGVIESTLMQGHSPNLNSNNSYIGDRKLPDDRADKIHVQVHLVRPNKPSNIDYYSPCFVIYLPVALTSQLGNLVTREGD